MAFTVYLSIIFIVTLVGGFIPRLIANSKRLLSYLVSLSAGVLVGTSLFHLLPEAEELLGRSTGWPLLLGFALFYVPQKYVLSHPCEEGDCKFHTLGVLAFFGIAFHSFVDGIGVGAGGHLPHLGSVIVTAIAIHKFPAAIALSFILAGSGMTRERVMTFLLLFALATPFGALFTYLVFGEIQKVWLGWALGLAAGNLMAVAGSDLLRRIHDLHDTERGARMVLLVVGIGLSVAVNGHP